jgi:hypothetical protein
VNIKLKMAICVSGMTQREIVAKAGRRISENRVSELVRGWRVPSAGERAILSEVLGQPATSGAVLLLDVRSGCGLESEPANLPSLRGHLSHRRYSPTVLWPAVRYASAGQTV